MRGWSFGARALLGAAALALTSAAGAQQTVPRAHGYAALDKLPDWSGVWSPDWSLLFGAGQARTPPAQPKLTPAAQARLDAFRKKQQEHGVDQTAQVLCLPPGMPGIMRQPYPIEFVYSPGRVTIFAETYSQARRIYLDQPLPEDPDPYFNGNSVGHWEGDTLIVDTVGFAPNSSEIGAGIPHGEHMKIHERIWLEKPDVMRIETTITDPDVLTEPYIQQLAYKKEPDWQIREYVCEENNRLRPDENGANIDLGLDDPDKPDPFAAAGDAKQP
jgi:hypothetical protein